MLLGFFCALAPYLVFHTTRPSDYPLLRNAAPILLVASIVAFNIWVWLLIWPRMQRHATVGSRGVRVVSWALGLLAVSALAVYFSSTALMMINVTTTDWMVW